MEAFVTRSKSRWHRAPGPFHALLGAWFTVLAAPGLAAADSEGVPARHTAAPDPTSERSAQSWYSAEAGSARPFDDAQHFKVALGGAVGAGAYEGSAHEFEDAQHAVLVVGAVAETGASGGSSLYGLTIGVEFPLVPEWLEVETGAAALTNSPRHEAGLDLTLKVPFHIGERGELMLGAGPFVTRAADIDGTRVLHGWEAVADIQFWTTHTGGWYVEPTWSRASETRERTWGLNIGLLFGPHE